jgi:two-component system, OmpR family, sensor histidine kinase CpxA
MRSLFLKIFLSFWLALALFMVLAILVTLAMRPPRENASVEALQTKFLEDTVQAYQRGGGEEARRYIRGLRDSQHVFAFVFNDQGQEITGRNPPDHIWEVARGKGHTIESIWGRIGPMQFLRPSIQGPDGHRYTMVIGFPPEQRTLFGPNGNLWLSILIAVLSSGLVCFPLARYLTSPIVRLRAATRKLAEGDLTARAGVLRFRRRDEMAELVRDFDAMAERLEKMVKAQSRLLSDISHELRSPLARLNVALALARQRSGDDAQPSLDRVETEAERLNELIGRLLTIARLESGDDVIQKYPVDLGELIAEIAQDADFEAQSRDCHVQLVATEDCFVIADPGLLHSAIENVVRNATRYTDEGTIVQVQLERKTGSPKAQAVIRVSDSGPGVPGDALEKIFRPFYRIDDARGRRTGGVGLGLAITQRAIRLHGGTVVASNRPGGGLVVEICLPLAPDQIIEPAALESQPALESKS